MDYHQTLDYLYNNLPVFQRVGGAAYKANLDNALALDEYMDHPHRSFKTIHIAGTNGKGSVSAMASGVLRAAGYRVGLYTSPHLRDFRERMTVDGEMIPRQDVVDFVAANLSKIEQLRPSFFEATVAMAFDYFRRARVDIAVVETGMGGRLDATNIITPIACVVTNISLDHTQYLGDTLVAIAGEKAGIIKRGVPVIIGETDPVTAPVFITKAQESDSPIFFADQRYRCASHDGNIFHVTNLLDAHSFDLELGMEGDCQTRNICTALALFDILDELGKDRIVLTGEQVRRGLRDTRVEGRWQRISEHPAVIVDTGHNEAGMRFVAGQLVRETYDKLHFVLGVVADKDLGTILPLLPRDAHYIFTQASLPRAMDYRELAAKARAAGLHGEEVSTVPAALERARKLASPGDLIFVGGSTFTVAEIL